MERLNSDFEAFRAGSAKGLRKLFEQAKKESAFCPDEAIDAVAKQIPTAHAETEAILNYPQPRREATRFRLRTSFVGRCGRIEKD